MDFIRIFGASRLLSLALFLSWPAAQGADLLADFQDSPLTSEHGRVRQIELRTPRLLHVGSHVLAFHSPGSMLHFRFAEPVWVLAYETEIHDADGKKPAENFLCHTFFGNQNVEQLGTADGKVISKEMKVLFSDAFTREIRLPEGFGLRLSTDDKIDWMPMFNNRGDNVTRVGMRAKVHFIREADLKKPLQPLHGIVKAVQMPHLFFVPPGRHEKETTFELPFDGRIHFAGAHIHPHVESIALFNVSRGELICKGLAEEDGDGETIGMDTYSDVEGYRIRTGEKFRLTSVYDNPTEFPIDAMAGAFIYYTRD
jgi:hypothetical protein